MQDSIFRLLNKHLKILICQIPLLFLLVDIFFALCVRYICLLSCVDVLKTGFQYNSKADSNMENMIEDEHMNVHEDGLKENDGNASSETQEVPFLTGLNLVLLVSYLSLSEDECLSLEDTEKIETSATQEPKDSILRSRAEKRKLHEPKLVETRVQRVQTKVRDCRYSIC